MRDYVEYFKLLESKDDILLQQYRDFPIVDSVFGNPLEAHYSGSTATQASSTMLSFSVSSTSLRCPAN